MLGNALGLFAIPHVRPLPSVPERQAAPRGRRGLLPHPAGRRPGGRRGVPARERVSGGRGDHDDGPLSQATQRDPQQRRTRRRVRQGCGNDRASPGDHARVRIFFDATCDRNEEIESIFRVIPYS